MTQQATELIAKQMAAGASIGKIWGTLVYNVKDAAYGATGNGTTNDAAAINAAIAAATNGGIIVFPPGTYYIGSTSLLLSAGKYMVGAGKHATTILYDGPTMNAISVTNISSSWGISDLRMKQTGTPTAGAAINVDTASNGTIERVYFETVYSGLHTKNAQANRYLNLDFWTFQNYGIAMLGGNNDIFIENCFINGQTAGGLAGPGTGLRLFDKAEAIMCVNIEVILCNYALTTDSAANTFSLRPAYNRFFNCFFDSSTNGVSLNNCTNMEFTQCWTSNRPNSGMVVNTVDDVTFMNCSFINSANHGCLVQSTAKRVKFIGCKFISNSTASAGTYHGLSIVGGTTDFVIQGCTITNGLGFSGIQGWGILVNAGASDRYIIADNLVTGNQQAAGVSDGGTGTNKRVANNY